MNSAALDKLKRIYRLYVQYVQDSLAIHARFNIAIKTPSTLDDWSMRTDHARALSHTRFPIVCLHTCAH